MFDTIAFAPNIDSHDDFFRQEELKSLYKSYVHHVLGRNNTLTGIRYKDEPTFFAFELMNEPRCLGYTEIKSQHCNVEGKCQISTHVVCAASTPRADATNRWYCHPFLFPGFARLRA